MLPLVTLPRDTDEAQDAAVVTATKPSAQRRRAIAARREARQRAGEALEKAEASAQRLAATEARTVLTALVGSPGVGRERHTREGRGARLRNSGRREMIEKGGGGCSRDRIVSCTLAVGSQRLFRIHLLLLGLWLPRGGAG